MIDKQKKTAIHLGDLTPAAIPDVIPIRTLITIFRAADPATVDLPPRGDRVYITDCFDFTTFHYHTVLLREAKYPLCFKAVVFCLAGNSFGITLFSRELYTKLP